MRTIKFRAWVRGQAMADWETITKECNRFTLLDDDNFVFMQYAGLKDKNGKEIYEADIYSQGEDNIRYTVMFIDCQFIGRQVGNRSLAGLTYFADDIEVIGNIHENPDLLK